MAYKTANAIISQVAVEVGLRKTSDAFAESDPAYEQMIYLANSCGNELLIEAEWGELRREKAFTTDAATNPDGIYDLPADFEYMIDQTGWERKENVPLFGPLSPQGWAYLIGRDLVNYTIYASFRLTQGKLYLFPQPPPDGLEIAYEYVSNNWVRAGDQADTWRNEIQAAGDTVLYQPYLFERLLKLRFLEARGFDTAKASDAYITALENWKGNDKSAPILNAANEGWKYPLLDPLRNLPDTNYGM